MAEHRIHVHEAQVEPGAAQSGSCCNTLTRICGFLDLIGIEVIFRALDDACFLPGIRIDSGRLLVDPELLQHPGDVLHEAGHLAVLQPAARACAKPSLDDDMGMEMAAIAWSYAASEQIGLAPEVVFHPHGYRGAAQGFIDNFRAGRYIAVPLLQWMDMCFEAGPARDLGVLPYPSMRRWLRGAHSPSDDGRPAPR